MNIFYEEEGTFKVGAILADNDTSLQVEAPHGKRSKVKAANVLFRFEAALATLPGAGAEIGRGGGRGLPVGVLRRRRVLLRQRSGRDYYGHAPSALESAALLLRLHGSPMYFYKKGKGRYRAAPPDALKAALASVERKRQQALAQARYMEQLARFELPEEFKPRLNELLYNPDRNTIEVKALEQAASAAGLSTAHLLEKCGAIPSTRDYHLNRFLLEHFPAGRGIPDRRRGVVPADLPLAPAEAFSIDDITTTEIDDAFSVRPLPGGRLGDRRAHRRAGAGDCARLRHSTGRPPRGCRRSTCRATRSPCCRKRSSSATRWRRAAARRRCRCTSMWGPICRVRGTRSAVEQVRIAANLRHDVAGGAVQRGHHCRRAARVSVCGCPARALGPGRSAGRGPRPSRAAALRCRWTTTSTSRTSACASWRASAAPRSTRWWPR